MLHTILQTKWNAVQQCISVEVSFTGRHHVSAVSGWWYWSLVSCPAPHPPPTGRGRLVTIEVVLGPMHLIM